MGGEHGGADQQYIEAAGSSPRGRGTPTWRACSETIGRFIPAWAGNTIIWTRGPGRESVHPRVGGEHSLSRTRPSWSIGSSPRGRGTPIGRNRPRPGVRFIPAWAGNTPSRQAAVPSPPVHPRVGGEHELVIVPPIVPVGSSPRGRGTRWLLIRHTVSSGFIPAWAGNTRMTTTSACASTVVHPRVGGEHNRWTERRPPPEGSSPRGRGTQQEGRRYQSDRRFIPAWAGNTPSAGPRERREPVHPRVGGEHRNGTPVGRSTAGSSPRGRGTQRSRPAGATSLRFIPAWAGNTPQAGDDEIDQTVHPRVGGEHDSAGSQIVCNPGSSPRGRGTR